jgi:RNA polymerase sigma-70 factor (ECF subfamily)
MSQRVSSTSDGELSFGKLVEPHRKSVRLHCYRMLGSAYDCEDMVQETFVRALRALDSLVEPAAARGWLYRIATNVCLDELQKRAPRVRGPELGPPSRPEATSPAPLPDEAWLEPMPSAWLTQADPAARYSLKESVALAFVAALQILTPAQRAVLLLRDVVGLSAEETASALACSVSAANSMLHRARVTLEERTGPRDSWSPDPAAAVDRALLERYLRAWESEDLDTIVALLHEDVTLSMPPVPRWLSGSADVGLFFRTHVQPSAKIQLFRAALVEANGALSVAFYRVRDDGQAHLFAIQTYELSGGRIREIDHFMSKRSLVAFVAQGLATTIAG